MAKKKPEPSPEAKSNFEQTLSDFAMEPEEYHVVQAERIWEMDDLEADLSVEEKLFVRSYIIDRNEIAALRRLNYTGDRPKLKAKAARMMAKSEVQFAIDHLASRLMSKLEVTAERVQRRIAAVAFFDAREVMQFDKFGVSLINSKFWTEEQMQAVQSVKMGANGIEIKMYDGLRAAEMLAKQIGVQPEDNELERAAAAKAGADAVMQKIWDIFNKTVPDDPEPAGLPEPEMKRLN